MRHFSVAGLVLACLLVSGAAQPDASVPKPPQLKPQEEGQPQEQEQQQQPQQPEQQVEEAKAKQSLCACPDGWECKREGLCVPPEWNTTTACQEGEEACQKLVADALDLGRQWFLVISSSLEKESVVASEKMSEDYLQAWREKADTMLQRVEKAKTSMSEETQAGLKSIIQQAWEQKPIQQVDIALSQCADANDATHRRCFYNMVKVMSGSWVQRTWFPAKVVSTQSRYIGSLARAADYVRRKTGRPMVVDCYLLELLPNLNTPFFKPLKLFVDSQYKATSNTIQLHMVEPLKNTREEIAKASGLKVDQVIFERIMPVSNVFLNGTLPRPGEETDIVVRAGSPMERTFLGGSEKVVSVYAEDVVTLVAFGPQPIPETLQSYMQQLTTLGPVIPKNAKAGRKGLHWVFVDVGALDWKDHDAVYNTSVSMASIFNAHQEEAGGRSRLIPFSHQLTALRRLKGRAELIVTFAGNLQAGELLALASRGDERHILIEVGGTNGLTAASQKRMAADNWWEREAWEKTAFLSMDQMESRNYMYLAKKVDATLTTTHTFVDAWEDAGMKVGGFCPELGACQSQLWDSASACKEEDSERCESVVSRVMKAARSWTLLLTSSGGGGHLVAAKVLSRRAARSWNTTMAAALSDLRATKGIVSQRAYEGLHSMVAFAEKAQPVTEIDLMNSPCSNLLGEHGIGLGKAFSTIYNVGQAIGGVKALKGLVSQQGIEDDIFHKQCQKYMHNVIGGNRLTRVSPPSSVVSCQPMQHSAIAAALHEVSTEVGEQLTLDIYLTDLPTIHCSAFLHPIAAMAKQFPQAASTVRVHTVEFVEDTETLVARTGLNETQFIWEDTMPVDERLLGDELKGPGTETSITLEAKSPRELTFLGRQKKTFNISARDTVTLVMLGSQPITGTMREYMQHFVQATPQKALEDPEAFHYVFFAAGDPTVSQYDKLYISLADLADRFNFLQRMTGGKVRLVPFTRQPAVVIESRADVIVSKSGGITSGELLAMAKRGDQRKVFLHLEPEISDQVIEPDVSSPLRHDWEKMSLVEGMLEWEMGNAVYLQKAINASLITPKKVSSVW